MEISLCNDQAVIELSSKWTDFFPNETYSHLDRVLVISDFVDENEDGQ